MADIVSVHSSVDRAKFQELAFTVKASYGIEINADAGSTEKSGLGVRWNYVESEQTLTLTCFKKEWWMPDSAIQQHLDGLA